MHTKHLFDVLTVIAARALKASTKAGLGQENRRLFLDSDSVEETTKGIQIMQAGFS